MRSTHDNKRDYLSAALSNKSTNFPASSTTCFDSLDDLDIYVPQPHTPDSNSFAYADEDYHARQGGNRKVATHWYALTTSGPLEHPPELPRNHRGLRHNDLFVHVDRRKKAEIDDSGREGDGKPLVLSYITMWVWDDSDGRWESITYGAERVVENRLMRLSLYRGWAEPQWITIVSWNRKQYPDRA